MPTTLGTDVLGVPVVLDADVPPASALHPAIMSTAATAPAPRTVARIRRVGLVGRTPCDWNIGGCITAGRHTSGSMVARHKEFRTRRRLERTPEALAVAPGIRNPACHQISERAAAFEEL
ncbi:hypothetical protein ABZW03_04690 [Kitasatospora sp. NPDC004799]|uniref:hypothetical protein n=1 Tax=Kitasatospora sp. NPDC004799 TaxID=3154460 RepID=UPI0033A2936B